MGRDELKSIIDDVFSSVLEFNIAVSTAAAMVVCRGAAVCEDRMTLGQDVRNVFRAHALIITIPASL